MSDRLNFSDIERNATPQSIEGGREYYEWGQVQSIVRRGSLLQASVMGQSEPWYETFLDVERCEGDCSCPYDWGGWCKHIVALALTYLNDSEQIENRFSLDELIEIIEYLVARHPFLIEDIETYVREEGTLFDDFVTQLPPPKATLDAKPFRQQIDRMITEGIDWIESGENYYDDDNPLEADVFQVIPSIDTYLDRNDGHNAIAILEVVTDVYFKRRDDLYNYGLDLLDFCEELDRLWAKALLIADLEEPKKIDLEVVFASQAEIFPSLFSLRRLALEKG